MCLGEYEDEIASLMKRYTALEQLAHTRLETLEAEASTVHHTTFTTTYLTSRLYFEYNYT